MIDNSRATVITLSSVQPERVNWLWPGRFPAGKLVVLDGDPSLGKSTLALTFAAHISKGTKWPDDAPCPLGDVVIMSAEDGLADTIRPRLDAAGGDPDRVHAITAVPYANEDGEVRHRPPTLADTAVILDVIERHKARLLVVDVLMAYMPTKVDSHRDQDVRGVLHQIAAIAEKTGATILLLRHLNKAGGGAAMYRGGGSIGIIGAARAGYLVALDPEDEKVRVLACVKNNLAPQPASLAYQLETVTGTDVARVVWAGESKHAATALLAGTVADEDRHERDEAAEWLTDYLTTQGGSARPGDAKKAARADGIATRTLERARTRAGVRLVRTGFPARAMWTIDPSVSPPVSPDSPAHESWRNRRNSGETGSEPNKAGETGVESVETPGQDPIPPPETFHTSGNGGPPEDDPAPACVGCGQRLLLVRPGRTKCERCRLADERAGRQA